MTTTTKQLTATITGHGLAPYGLGETIEVLSDSNWDDLARQVNTSLAELGADSSHNVTVTYRDRDGDEVDIHDHI